MISLPDRVKLRTLCQRLRKYFLALNRLTVVCVLTASVCVEWTDESFIDCCCLFALLLPPLTRPRILKNICVQ